MNRIIDVFPTAQQAQVRAQLALVLEGVLSQTLIPKVGGGRVMALDVPVRCAGVKVSSGDLVFGDADGVVVIPRAVEQQVLALALDKIKGEKRTLDELRAGEKLGDVFAKYGIL